MVSYMASVTEAHSVHASCNHLHNFLWQGHRGRLLPLKDVAAIAQLPDIPLAQNKNLACLLSMTPVRNYYIISCL